MLDEALQVLSVHTPAPPPEGVAHAALLCLQLLGVTLEREEEFMDQVRRAKQQLVSVHPLHQLLQGVNPRSGKADHMINIARSAHFTKMNYVCTCKSTNVQCMLSSIINSPPEMRPSL